MTPSQNRVAQVFRLDTPAQTLRNQAHHVEPDPQVGALALAGGAGRDHGVEEMFSDFLGQSGAFVADLKLCVASRDIELDSDLAVSRTEVCRVVAELVE